VGAPQDFAVGVGAEQDEVQHGVIDAVGGAVPAGDRESLPFVLNDKGGRAQHAAVAFPAFIRVYHEPDRVSRARKQRRVGPDAPGILPLDDPPLERAGRKRQSRRHSVGGGGLGGARPGPASQAEREEGGGDEAARLNSGRRPADNSVSGFRAIHSSFPVRVTRRKPIQA